MFELYRKQHIVTILKEKEKEKEKRGLSRLCSRCTIFQLGKTWVQYLDPVIQVSLLKFSYMTT